MRNEFVEQKDRLVDGLVGTGEIVDEMLGSAIRSLADHDAALAARVVARDNEVDQRYVDTQNDILRVIALQAPVAGDVRLLSSMLHVNIHLERMGDYATTIAKRAQHAEPLKSDSALTEQMLEMVELAQRVGREAMKSYAQKDLALARRLPELDDGVDRLNKGIFRRLIELATQDPSRLEWATSIMLVPRHVERYGDHAVDIGEQTIYAITGSTVELSSNDPDEG